MSGDNKVENQKDISQITDQNELNQLYVECNERFLQAQQVTQAESQNMQVLRAQMQKVLTEKQEADDKKK